MNPAIEKYVSFDHCRAVLPWFQFASSREPLPRLRKLILEMEAGMAGQPAPNIVIAACFHFPISLRQIWFAFRQYGSWTRNTFKIGYHRQIADLIYLSWRLNHSPHDYYLQKMWLQPDRRKWAQFLQQREHVLFVKHLQRKLPLEEFDDKLNFFRRMSRAAIPTIEILLVASHGRWSEEFDGGPKEHLLQQDIIVKPTDGAMSDRVEVWRYNHERDCYNRTFSKINGIENWAPDLQYNRSELLGHVLKLSEQRSYIIQPLLKNNPTLELISPRLIANFRIVTASLQGRPTVIAALLRMGYKTPTFEPGNYQANIDLETGVLSFATGRQLQWGFGVNHLETGHPVKDRVIENWLELRALALRGHEQFPWMPTIGWDVIDSDRGPMLMEANAFWGVDITQVDSKFLGETGYAEACLECYEREWPEEKRPENSA